MQAVKLDDILARASAQLSATPRPFLRWAGSKRRLLPELVEHLPDQFGTYWEPFLGSGSLYFCLQPETAHLNDSCTPLIQTYAAIRDGAWKVSGLAQQYEVDRDTYYRVRRMRPSCRFERAAQFIYLNKTCWNGLYRVNSQGMFNVPYGLPKSSNILDQENLVACGRLIRQSSVTLTSVDFEAALDGVSRTDIVYLDPPYVTRHNNNGFIDYNRLLFNWDDQIRLASTASRLRGLGATVVVSNAFHDDLLALYGEFDIFAVGRPSTLAGDVSKRSRVTEALFVGAP
jgi:DNA adenine methylase